VARKLVIGSGSGSTTAGAASGFSAGEGFDEARVAGGVAESFAEAVYGGVDAVLVVDEGAFGPEFAGDFFAGEQLAGAFEQHEQHLKGLDVYLDANSLLAQLSGG